MKYTSFTAALILIAACNNNTNHTSAESNDTASINNATTEAPVSETHCYAQYDKDSMWLQVTKSGESITGNYTINIQGKDKNTGSISGIMRGDTLIVDYTFLSEGTHSVRQVVFLKKDNTMIEGFGAIEDKGEKMVFKNTGSLHFDEKMKLTEVPCKQ